MPTLRSFSGRVRSLPEDRDILCAAWLGSGLLLLGLSKGDVLFVSAAPAAAEANSGVRVGQELRLTEQLVKDRGSGLQALLSGFLAGAADANCDTTAIAAQSATALAANRSGELRLWSAATRQLVAQVSLYDLLDAVGAVGDLAPPHFQHRAARGAAPDKSILLQG